MAPPSTLVLCALLLSLMPEHANSQCAAGNYYKEPTWFMQNNNIQSCVNCGAGKYSSEGDTTCTDCATGKYSMATGASTADTCETCSPNSEVSKEGSAACECASGRASAFDVVIMSVCDTCICKNRKFNALTYALAKYVYFGIYGDQPYFGRVDWARILWYSVTDRRWYVTPRLPWEYTIPYVLRSQTISIDVNFNFNVLTWDEGECVDTQITGFTWVNNPFITSVQIHTSACLTCVPGKYAAATGASVCRDCVVL